MRLHTDHSDSFIPIKCDIVEAYENDLKIPNVKTAQTGSHENAVRQLASRIRSLRDANNISENVVFRGVWDNI